MVTNESFINPDREEIEARIARFAHMSPLESQTGHDIPQHVADLIWSRRLLPVLTRADEAPGPFGTRAPIKGAGDMSITYAACPPHSGPSLHAHRRTYETFTVLRGRFQFFIGDTGQESVTLDPFDAISVPPGVHRAFRNVSDEDGLLQVIITGGIHDQNDIIFPSCTAQEIAAHDPAYLSYFKALGLAFVD